MSARLPSVSVVIPTRNRPQQLERCLAALACTDYPRDLVEVVVVDDGGDGSLQHVVECFAGAFDLQLVPVEHVGPAAARNVGAREAHGTLLCFTDDDCVPDSGWIRALVDGMRGADAVVGGKTVNGAPENPFSTAAQAIVDWVYTFYNEGSGGPRFFASNNLAMPRMRFLKVGGFDVSFTTSEDRELCDRCRHLGLPFVYVGAARVAHDTHLSLTGFARRHFAYGRGAYRYHALRRRRRSGSVSGDLPFHLQLPRRAGVFIRDAGPGRGVRLTGLLIVWQLANAAGFAWEGLRTRLIRR